MTKQEITTKQELEQIVQELRGLKIMCEELDNEVKALENSIIAYMTEHELDTEMTSDSKITYKPQTRETVNKDEVKKLLSKEDYQRVSKVSVFNVLRIK